MKTVPQPSPTVYTASVQGFSGVLVTLPDGETVFYNPMNADLVSWATAQHLGLQVHGVLAPAMTDGVLTLIRQAREGQA